MKPVKGGLASLSEAAEAKLKAERPDESIPAWAFRFLQSLPDVVVTPSGMSDMQQLKDNLSACEESKPLNDAEMISKPLSPAPAATTARPGARRSRIFPSC